MEQIPLSALIVSHSSNGTTAGENRLIFLQSEVSLFKLEFKRKIYFLQFHISLQTNYLYYRDVF